MEDGGGGGEGTSSGRRGPGAGRGGSAGKRRRDNGGDLAKFGCTAGLRGEGQGRRVRLHLIAPF